MRRRGPLSHRLLYVIFYFVSFTRYSRYRTVQYSTCLADGRSFCRRRPPCCSPSAGRPSVRHPSYPRSPPSSVPAAVSRCHLVLYCTVLCCTTLYGTGRRQAGGLGSAWCPLVPRPGPTSLLPCLFFPLPFLFPTPGCPPSAASSRRPLPSHPQPPSPPLFPCANHINTATATPSSAAFAVCFFCLVFCPVRVARTLGRTASFFFFFFFFLALGARLPASLLPDPSPPARPFARVPDHRRAANSTSSTSVTQHQTRSTPRKTPFTLFLLRSIDLASRPPFPKP